MTDSEDPSKWRIATDALSDLLAQTPPDVPIAMVTFTGTVREVFDFLHGRTAISRWLNEWPAQFSKRKYPRGTALRDAVLEGLKLLSPPQRGDVIYAITDGGENKSQASEAQTKAALFQSGVRLFAFLSSDYFPREEELISRNSFADFIVDSGGSVLGTSGLLLPNETRRNIGFPYGQASRGKVKAATDVLINHINGFWTLELDTPLLGKSSRVKLEIVGDGGRTKRDLRVTYPHVLFAGR